MTIGRVGSFFAIFAAIVVSRPAAADIVLENDGFTLTIGENAAAKSLVLGTNGEECLDAREGIALFSVTQERPFNNEIKLAWPNKRTTYQANRVRREGEDLVVGFETVPYEARVRVARGPGYLAFTLVDFITDRIHQYPYLAMEVPPACEFRVLQLPVKNRANVGDWLNVVWDDRAATAVVGLDPYCDIDHERRFGFEILRGDLARGRKLRGGAAAIVAAPGRDAFLEAMDRLEADFGLPRGVQSRRDSRLNASIAWTAWATPANFDHILETVRKGGFRMMMLYYSCFTDRALEIGYGCLHDYNWKKEWPNGEGDLDSILGKIKASGLTAGLHVLQTHVGLFSSYVTPVADPRLNLKRRFTLMKAISAEGEIGEILVSENPVDSPRFRRPPRSDGLPGGDTRVLKFGGELFLYESFTTEKPYRFLGVKRGAYDTTHVAHRYGEIGGVLDVSEYAAVSCYADQNTDLPDEIGAKIAKIYDRGFEFFYFDGSEGVNPPCNINVSLAQLRVTEKCRRQPLFTEGAAKSHFGWHLQAGANAFDVFPPEVFKEMIVKHPQAEAPMMRKDMTRLDFGWWSINPPGTEVKVTVDNEIRKITTIGTQPDMWEFGTSRAAAWDCPATVMFNPECFDVHPRMDDLLEVMRRWEDVRARNLLTPEMKERLKSTTQEHHLYLNGKGEYELVDITMLTKDVPGLRAFLFERGGKRVIAYWHTSGEGEFTLPLGDNGENVVLRAKGLRYFETNLAADRVRKAFGE